MYVDNVPPCPALGEKEEAVCVSQMVPKKLSKKLQKLIRKFLKDNKLEEN